MSVEEKGVEEKPWRLASDDDKTIQSFVGVLCVGDVKRTKLNKYRVTLARRPSSSNNSMLG